MKESKWIKRDKKIKKRKHGMRTDGKSVFIIQKVQKDKADENSPNSRARQIG